MPSIVQDHQLALFRARTLHVHEVAVSRRRHAFSCGFQKERLARRPSCGGVERNGPKTRVRPRAVVDDVPAAERRAHDERIGVIDDARASAVRVQHQRAHVVDSVWHEQESAVIGKRADQVEVEFQRVRRKENVRAAALAGDFEQTRIAGRVNDAVVLQPGHPTGLRMNRLGNVANEKALRPVGTDLVQLGTRRIHDPLAVGRPLTHAGAF